MESDLLPDNSDSNIHRSFTSSSSPPDFLRNVQAAFKRHRMMPQLKPRRLVVRGETLKSSDPKFHSKTGNESNNISLSERVHDSILQTKYEMSSSSVCHEEGPITITTVSCETNVEGNSSSAYGIGSTRSNMAASSFVEHGHFPLIDGPKKVQFALQKNAELREMECDGTDQLDASIAPRDKRHQKFRKSDIDLCQHTDDEVSSLDLKSTIGDQDQVNSFRNFVKSNFGHNMTQSSVVGSSCATTTLVNPEYAPMLNSTTHEKRNGFSDDRQGKEGDCGMKKDPNLHLDRSNRGDTLASNITDTVGLPMADDQFSNVKMGPSKSEKKEKVDASKSTRKRNYDPDLFFKVNGKLYQRLGKIGSGGSSEVHKVISQDCTIYALKKIKLKGRDHATAYGFCQEIEYLNKLKGREHIIQLIDYEVTDKALLKEVMNGSMSNKDGKVKDDGYIYMVLEYGEIDLAHMLSHKWKEIDKSKLTIDENWLRFYWQQILLAVKTIHEERIVHSDLKPANFLLVRGSLKLIDFGIAKAIMSDTTNIQRDSQVGTLSYMSPEAFMCNETDANGNMIKCGRPSDIWSLGCILYQMVYGRTPFSDYKTFWAKFKVVTDPDYQIPYEPICNPWLLDLMKKCLAWDRNERWRIPQLLQHPFLVPPIPSLEDKHGEFLNLVSKSFSENPKALILCTPLKKMLTDPLSEMTTVESKSVQKEHASTLLYEVSKLCVQLKEVLATSELNLKR